MAYISQITPLGSSTTYDLKAAMLTHTPNNTTTFLRGDNTWSNTLTGNLLLSKDANTEWANSPQLQLTGADDKIAAIKLTNSGTNLDIGWDWTARTGAGLGLRSTSSTDTAGGFYLFARNATENHELVGTAGGDLTWSGLLKITNNSNTTTIGSQTTTFCHIYNSANIPFIFNNSILTTGGNLGDSTYPFDSLTLGRSNGAGIYYKGTKATYRMIRFIDNTSDNYGNGISIGGGGQTIIGGGESADTAAAQAGTAGGEIMQVCNDGNVELIANLQNGWDNRKVLTLNTSGYLMCPSYINVPTGNNENPTLSQFIVTNGSDHYYRKASAAHAMAAIRSNASGSWGISITGNAATATKANGLVDGTSTMTSAYNKAGLNYADYSWLAGWNGYELRAVAKTQFAQASHNHYQLTTEGDNRSVATTPNSYNNNLVFRGLKTNSAFGSPSSDNYSYVIGLRGWQDASGGNAYELAFNNTGIYCRNGATTSWGSWKRIPMGDGTGASGTWGINITGNAATATDATYDGTCAISAGDSNEVNFGGTSTSDVIYFGYRARGSRPKPTTYVFGSSNTGSATIKAAAVYGAVWNDYAEYRKDNPNEIQEPGRCVKELGNGALALTTKRLERGCEIISDTFGFAIGQDEENDYNTPIASNGRVLVYPYESIEEFTTHIGWPVCSGPNGTVSIMTEEEEEKYPSRIIGTISEIPTYEEWGTGNVKVNGRVWIRIR